MDRCALFVDAGYMLADGAMAVHGTRNRESVSWDYAGVIQFLGNMARDRTGLPLLRCYWYEATVEGRRTPEHDALADLPGVKLRLGRMRPGRREGVESEIHRDLATLARNHAASDALVVSAEEDLAQVIADVQDLGMRVTIVHITVGGNWTISRTLRQECDGILEIGEAHLRPYVELVAGAELVRDDDRQIVGAYAGRSGSNGHGPIGALGHQPALPVGSHPAPPSIYTAPVIAEYQRVAQPLNGQSPSLSSNDVSGPVGIAQQHQGPGPQGGGQIAGQQAPQAPSQHAGPQLDAPAAADANAGGPPGAPAQQGSQQQSMTQQGMQHSRPLQPQPSAPMGHQAPTGPVHPGHQVPSSPPLQPLPPGMGGPSGMHPSSPPGPAGQPGQGMPPHPGGAPGASGGQGMSHRGQRQAGPSGQAGPGGQPGMAGPSGHPGMSGPLGQPGSPGSGQPGMPGQSGQAGMPGGGGQPGMAGPSGHPGMSGPLGQPGSPGSGQPGMPGPVGQQGMPGVGMPGPSGQQGMLGQSGQPGSGQAGMHSPAPGMPQPGQSPGLTTSQSGMHAPSGSPGVPPSAMPQQGLPQQGMQAGQPIYPAPPPTPGGYRGPGPDGGQGGQAQAGARQGMAGSSAEPMGAGPLPAGPMGQPASGGPHMQAPPRPYPGEAPGGRFGPGPQDPRADQFPGPGGYPSGPYAPPQGPYSGPQPAAQHAPVPQPMAISLADAVQAAYGEGFQFGQAVARDAPALWLEAVVARKPRMPSDLEARLLQDSALPIDSLLHDEVRHALRRGFWDALERARH